MIDNTKDQNTDFKIIIIDDTPSIHQDFIKILTPIEQTSNLSDLQEKIFGEKHKTNAILPRFQIDTATQGLEGVEKIKLAFNSNNPFALAFVDMRMPPGLDGVETIKQIWAIDPRIQVVICTAFSDYTWEETIEQLGMTDNLLILKKPFDNTAVRQLASALTRKWELMRDLKKHEQFLEKNIEERTSSLRQSLSITRSTLESSADGIVVVSNEGKIVDYNNQFISLWKIPPTLIDTKDYNLILQYILDQLKDPKAYIEKFKSLQNNSAEINLLQLDCNDNRIFEQYTQPQKLDEKIVGRVWSFRDITERKLLEKKLEIQATHDPLTGLPNRALLYDRIQYAISESMNTDNIVGVLFFDLDRFKLINDSLGHKIGDQLLQIVAKRLESCVRPVDTIARQGGDEFVMVVHSVRTEQEIEIIAQKLLSVVTEPFNIEARDLAVGASVGIAVSRKDDQPEVLLRNADLAMYRAKKLGGNRFQFYSPEFNKEAILRLEREKELSQAITNNEFYLYYKPEFSIKNNELVTVAALIRWKHPKYGELLPMEFIPIADETGLIIAIGKWVLMEACKQNKIWQENGLGLFQVGVNVGKQQLKDSNFDQVIQKIIEETGLDPQYLELEITANMIIRNPEVIPMINKLSKIGVKIALDNFGTDDSTLSNLDKVHVDRLKIDNSFIQRAGIGNSNEVVVQAIMDMSRNLNYNILAEGPVAQKHLDSLKEKNSAVVQGFYFGDPMQQKEFEKFIESTHQEPGHTTDHIVSNHSMNKGLPLR